MGTIQEIEEKDGDKVLGFEGGAGSVQEGTKVYLEELLADPSLPTNNQRWVFNMVDNNPNGYFTIISVTTQMLLHGNSRGDAFVGYENFQPPLDYDDGPKSNSITSRESMHLKIA